VSSSRRDPAPKTRQHTPKTPLLHPARRINALVLRFSAAIRRFFKKNVFFWCFKRGTGPKHCGGFARQTPQKMGLRDSELRVARGTCAAVRPRSAFASRSPALALSAGLQRQHHVYISTDKSFCLHNNKFD